jgi:DNA-binding CsgD family transcriptional regulator
MIPAGLTDNNIEFFSHNGELFSVQDGQRYTYPSMPQSHLMFLYKQFAEDPAGRDSVSHLIDRDKLKTYSICRFGGCNSIPDASSNLDLLDASEYYDCGIRGNCPWEGKRCKEIVAEKGIITARQLEIMKLVALGLYNKEIADRLQISENTVANHLSNIFDKLGDRSRVIITSFIKERGII